VSAVSIRAATAADARALAALGERTFRETFVEDFAMPYSPSDVATFIATTYTEGALGKYLHDAAYRHFIATHEDRPVGFALVGPNGLPHGEARDGDGELKRIYVIREAQALGVGRVLFDAAVGWLESAGPRRVWIGVWSGNERAKRFYARRGFVKVGEYSFRVGETLDHEHILRRG
jgi:ribosomal protein S18 acetylase RimI-like enzyme